MRRHAILFAVLLLVFVPVPGLRPLRAAADKIDVAVYYFGNFHPGDPRNARSKGEGWSEWELVKAARPRFPGHQQPKVPLWGYGDESDPAVMARKIDAAADHGIDAFIFDWYYYDDGPFLDRSLDRGFLKAANNSRLRFALMWANHDWVEIHPYRRGAPQKVLYPGGVKPETFSKICDHVIGDYFSHPSYWRIDGRPYFSFYDLSKLIANFGSVQGTRAALDAFRQKARAAGLPGLHLNTVVWGRTILPGEKTPADPARLVSDLGFDSVTSYVWVHHVSLDDLVTPYDLARDAYVKYWDSAEGIFRVPYFPNVSMGWDSSPRAAQDDAFGNFGYPFTNTIGGNTPERFRAALELTRDRLLSKPAGARVVTINSWNEWTEGSYLEPDTISGMRYLEAVRDVFGAPQISPGQAEQIQREILDCQRRMKAAAEKLDVDGLFSHVLDNENVIIENGRVRMTRREAYDATRSGMQGVQQLSYDYTRTDIRVLSPAIALWTGQGTTTATLGDGRTITAPFAETIVFERRDGRWKVSHAHRSSPNR
jgi:ketosteroid isomerase-like protein